MANVKAFKGLRYDTKKVGSLDAVTAPPYDIISQEEQDALYKNHKNNIINLELGKIYDTDTDSNNRYTRARDCLNAWMNDGVLKFDEKQKEITSLLYEYVLSSFFVETYKSANVLLFLSFMSVISNGPISFIVIVPISLLGTI